DENFRGTSINGIGELRVDSPLLLAVSRLPVAPGVPYHTIAFRFAGLTPNDLVVPLWSARLDGAASEAIFPGYHGSEQSPAALGELRRILLEHLAGPCPTRPPLMRTARAAKGRPTARMQRTSPDRPRGTAGAAACFRLDRAHPNKRPLSAIDFFVL
ncbi:MAG TPA: hypothetical protein VKP69_19715, partial [Isosphaeraceae bacterium]|nr:hypothetical protein [Isosphaeraceae bacterium]